MAQIDLTGIEKICVQWPRFGPYHLARLHAAHKACSARNIEFIALETAAKSGLYEWKVEDGETPFDRQQVFVDRPLEDISPTEMHDAYELLMNTISSNRRRGYRRSGRGRGTARGGIQVSFAQ